MTSAKALFVAFSALAAMTSCAFAAPVSIKTGFYDGNSYRALLSDARSDYVVGVIEGMFLAPLFDAPKQKVLWVEACITGMNNEQLRSVIDKWMRDNPVRWHEPMHTLVYSALRESCPTR